MAVKLNPADYEFADQQQPEEGWGEYAVRGAAKIPALTYSALRSGLGLGDLASYLRRPENPDASLTNAALRGLLPTYQEARGEASRVLPSYFAEQRPGDLPAEFLGELVGTAPLAGVKTLGQAGRYGARALSGLAGSYLGGTAGHMVGGQPGEVAGSILGALYGSHIAPFQGKKQGIRPSKTLIPEIAKEESSALQNMANKFEETKAARIAAVNEKFDPKIIEAKKQHKLTRRELAAERDKFERKKAAKISAIDEKIVNLDKNIEGLLEGRKPNYKQASLHKVQIEAPTTKINDVINDTSLNLGGTSSAEQSLIFKALNDVEEITKSGKATIGQLERVEKNLGGQISAAKKSGHANVVRHLGEVKESLKDVILEHGPAELVEPWLKGEEATWKASQLKKQKPVTKAELQAERARIKSEKYPEAEKIASKELLEESKGRVTGLQKQQKDIIDAIGKERYEDFIKNRETPPNIQTLVKEFEKGKKKNVISNLALGTLQAALGYLGLGSAGALIGAPSLGKGIHRAVKNIIHVGKHESAILDYAKTHHRPLYDQYMKTLTSIDKKNIPIVALRLNDINKRMEEAYSNQESSGLNPDEYDFA